VADEPQEGTAASHESETVRPVEDSNQTPPPARSCGGLPTQLTAAPPAGGGLLRALQPLAYRGGDGQPPGRVYEGKI
jgi:hypothetical protein